MVFKLIITKLMYKFYHDFSCQREQSQACLSYAECSREWSATQFVNYMVENYSATPDQLMLDWNCVGAPHATMDRTEPLSSVYGNALTDISESPT